MISEEKRQDSRGRSSLDVRSLRFHSFGALSKSLIPGLVLAIILGASVLAAIEKPKEKPKGPRKAPKVLDKEYYHDKELDFIISAVEGYKIKRYEKGIIVKLERVVPKKGLKPAVSVALFWLKGDQTLRDSVSSQYQRDLKLLKEYELKTLGEFTFNVGSSEGWAYGYEWKQRKERLRMLHLFIPSKLGRVFVITWADKAKDFEDHEIEFKTITETFRILS